MWVGIDYDTFAVHLVRLPEEDGEPTYHPIPLEGDDAFERARRVSWELPGPGFWDDVTACGIEEPGGKYNLGKLNKIQGAIITSVPEDLLLAPFQAGLWRKLCGLPGNATKHMIRVWVMGRLDQDPHWPQDAFDAYALAYAVSQQTEVRRVE